MIMILSEGFPYVSQSAHYELSWTRKVETSHHDDHSGDHKQHPTLIDKILQSNYNAFTDRNLKYLQSMDAFLV